MGRDTVRRWEQDRADIRELRRQVMEARERIRELEAQCESCFLKTKSTKSGTTLP